MKIIIDYFHMEIFFKFIFPFIIFIGLYVGFYFYKTYFKKCSIDSIILAALIIGGITTSFINIPIWFSENQILFLNFGSTVIPLFLSFIFIFNRKLTTLTIIELLFIIIFTTEISFLISYVDVSIGIIQNFPDYFLPILTGILLSMAFVYFNKEIYNEFDAVTISYSVTTIGVFIGADILLLPAMLNQIRGNGYIGGFGIFDLIYFSGICALTFSLIIYGFKNQYNIKIKNQQQTKAKNFKTLKNEKHIDTLIKKRINRNIKNFQMSPFQQRLKAFIIDCLIQLSIIILLFLLIFNNSIAQFDFNSTFSGVKSVFILGWGTFIHIFYFVIFEFITGQTPGKHICHIIVITPTKENYRFHRKNQIKKLYRNKEKKDCTVFKTILNNNFKQIFTRNILRLLEIMLGLYIVSLILILLVPDRQRIGDYFAQSYVVSTKY